MSQLVSHVCTTWHQLQASTDLYYNVLANAASWTAGLRCWPYGHEVKQNKLNMYHQQIVHLLTRSDWYSGEYRTWCCLLAYFSNAILSCGWHLTLRYTLTILAYLFYVAFVYAL